MSDIHGIITKIKALLAPPTFEKDEKKTRSARILNHLLNWILALLLIPLLLGLLFIYTKKLDSFLVIFLLYLAAVFAKVAMFKGRVYRASQFLVVAFWAVFMMLIALGAGMSDFRFIFIVSIMIWSGLLLGKRSLMIMTAISAVAGLFMAIGEYYGYLPFFYFSPPPLATWTELFMAFILAATTAHISIKSRDEALTLAHEQLDERRRAEEELRRSEERFSKAFHASPAPTAISRIKDGGLLVVNDQWCRMLDYSREEVIGRTPEELSLLWPNLKERTTLVGKYLEQGFCREQPMRFRTKSGEIKETLVSADIIKYGDEDVILSLFFDVTERNKAEEERRMLQERLQRAEKMEALGTLAGGVAHDLNNVLGVLVGYSELLLLETPEGHPLRRHTSNILQGGRRAAAIIQDLLTLARRGVTSAEPVNLNQVVSSFLASPECELLKSHHPGIDFKTDVDAQLLNISGSPVHLGKTLMNLVSNAAEAVSGFGKVTIKTENRYIDKPIPGYENTAEGEYAVLCVSDTGTGIPASDLKRIFEPFYTKKVMGRSGTGLGLAVVWGTVKDHNGYIDVESEEGKGTIFTLYFPATRASLVKDKTAVTQDAYLGRGEDILVVDDVREQRDLAFDLLRRLGYQAHTAPGGEEAVRYVKAHRIDLVILDMIMDPGIDGLETYQRILAVQPDMRAIIVSGFSETSRVKEALKKGAGAYVRKPYILEELGLAVRRELDRPRP
jgi:two-component system cell cycle sensor histidine kinase/response regulator CckA